MVTRTLSPLDRLLVEAQRGLETVLGNPPAQRPNPATETPDVELDPARRAVVVGQRTRGDVPMAITGAGREIQRMFVRKATAVSRCLSVAVDNKELPRSSRGKVTLDLTVNETGRTVQGKASGFASEVDSCISSQKGCSSARRRSPARPRD